MISYFLSLIRFLYKEKKKKAKKKPKKVFKMERKINQVFT
jgi:hypothetical protein